MTEYCKNCGEELKDDALFCPNCGEKVPGRQKNFLNKYAIVAIVIIIVIAVFLTSTFVLNQTQTVKVDNVEFQLPADYVNDPSRTDVSYDGNVKSSAMGWRNNDSYIEIGVTRTPGEGINSKNVSSAIGGTPEQLLGYSGYYVDYGNEGCAFVFGIKDEVIMVYVSDYDVFDDVKVIGRV